MWWWIGGIVAYGLAGVALAWICGLSWGRDQGAKMDTMSTIVSLGLATFWPYALLLFAMFAAMEHGNAQGLSQRESGKKSQ